ncbi:MAG: hypothetical protein QG629_803 [Patescibacteria group bacterium]|nr:hypothetical protein [Patescibacteria group bacterium]
MVILHIILAITSLLVGAATFFRPHQQVLTAYYVSAGLTTVSGVGLLFSGYSLTHTCIMGAIYLVGAFLLGAALHRKLANQKV